MPVNDRAWLREQIARLLRDAGSIALASAKGTPRQWTKAGNSPVSEADIAVNDFLTTHLPPLVPDAGWLSEETEDNRTRLQAKAIWIVDPIDGTRAYLEGREDWSVSVALVDNGRPSVTGLYAPARDEMFLAVRGEGATLNGARLSASAGRALDGARLAGPQSYLRRFAEMNPSIVPQAKIHSLALRIARVAAGVIDGAFASRNSHDWDLAAADLLVHEAGGALTDLEGRVVRYNRAETAHGALVAAGQDRHGALLELVRDRRSEFA